jgi:hypothetical protein
MLGAISQTRLKFAGVWYNPGDKIPPSELAKSTPVAVDALRNQNMIIFEGDSRDGTGGAAALDLESLKADVASLREAIGELSAKVDQIADGLGNDVVELGKLTMAGFGKLETAIAALSKPA